jgi:hypothetical protein
MGETAIATSFRLKIESPGESTFEIRFEREIVKTFEFPQIFELDPEAKWYT